MAIKWEDIKIGCSMITDSIYIGKIKKTKNGLDIWTDKSGDKTQECVKAVMEHMLGICKRDNLETITFTIDEICELTLTNLNKPNK